MSDSVEQEKTPAPSTTQAGSDSSPVGQRWVGRNFMILLALYLVLVSVVLVFGIIQVWPPPTENSATAEASKTTFLFWNFTMSAEGHLILVVILASAIGAQAHALRSLYWYVGNRQLRFSWMMRYILMPFAGITFGLTFYFVIRGGFFAAGTNVKDLSPYGFTAMAFLVGMFTDQAAERLKKVAESLFAKPGVGADSHPPQGTES
jgi:hypothetical protein